MQNNVLVTSDNRVVSNPHVDYSYHEHTKRQADLMLKLGYHVVVMQCACAEEIFKLGHDVSTYLQEDIVHLDFNEALGTDVVIGFEKQELQAWYLLKYASNVVRAYTA